MFERPHHQRIARVLEALDAALLRDQGCLFGGGTAMALRGGEYRESVDIDFLVSEVGGCRQLRQLLTGPQGINAVVRAGALLQQAREVRADQYGMRTALAVDGQEIKLEIVLEGRIVLEHPSVTDVVCGVATLTPLDMATSKLLANSDRWADDGVFSRDLIDLAMLSPKLPLLRRAVEKARGSYGDTVLRDLAKAIQQLKDRAGRLERCMQALDMRMPKAVLWERIRAVERSLPRLLSA
ncbi:MAG: nucleotidyl transferase AbiEii/AbiGii toxin family protein [Vitreoscilla sp.]|nr:nucleotidyl transferase AbiEii/AbiGii toxin family protein [Vitreoscilla sp.]